MSSPAEAARGLLETNRYVVLATVDAGGAPWATPVWFAHDGLDVLLWVSPPDSRHSRALAADPRLAVTVFDSAVEPGHGTAFYGRGRAALCPDADLADRVAVYSERSVAQGIGPWDVARVSGDSRLRLYVAHLDEVSVLLDTDGPEQRLPVDPVR